jgi:signal transduction histidine kinase/DNA-binding response OmpR family regulator
VKLTLLAKVIIGMLLASSILTLEAGYLHRSSRGLISATEEVRYRHLTITQLEALLAAVEHLEARQRAYLLTGRTDHGAAFHRSADAAGLAYDGVRETVPPGSGTADMVQELGLLIDRRVSVLTDVIAIYETQGLEAARAEIVHGVGPVLMDSVRAGIRQIGIQEHARLADAVVRLDASSNAITRGFYMTALAVLLILLFGSIGIVRDTRRRQQEEKLLRRAKELADGSNQAKSEFLATVSHEVRTPLNAIIGMTELLRASSLNSEQSELARMLSTNAESLLNLINDLLDSSKIEAQQVEIEHVPMSVRDTVEEVAEVLAIRAETKDLDLITWVERSVPERVLGDPSRLVQVLMNLAGNAIKFTQHGDVIVHASATPVDSADGRVSVTIEVKDTGMGIAPADQERIFDRFAQVDRSALRRFGGTGLGLNISRALVGLMGGRLELESEEGRGSIFRVILPMEIADESTVDAPALQDLRVLLIAAHATRRQALAELLQDAGAFVDTTARMVDILTSQEGAEWHVIVSEAPVTKMERLELAEVARRQNGSGAGMVCLTTLSAPSIENRLHAGGRLEYVLKPAKRSRLIQAVRVAAGMSVEPAAAEPGEARGRPRAHQLAPRILVVDDNRDNWHLVARILSDAGYDVDLADNGEVAVDRVRRFRYDLVLMDVDMPVMDGFTATAEIRALERSEKRIRTPIVALTAHAVDGFRERSLASGMDAFATKPIRGKQLRSLVAAWVDPLPVILVADDTPENAVVVQKYLEDEPVRMVFARNGEEALAAFERHRVSLILLDMDMPVLDGYDTARAIRKMRDGSDIPIVAMTGYTGTEERRKCHDAGCTAHLEKPIRRSLLLRTVRELLQEDLPSDAAEEAPSIVAPGTIAADVHARAEPARLREDLQRIRHLLDQSRFTDVVAYARHVKDILSESEAPELVHMASELVAAAESESAVSVRLWCDRVLDALQEWERLRVLRASDLLDASPEETFDRLTRLAARVLKAPAALVSLVDANRQFFFSQCGLTEPLSVERETPLSHSFCQHVVAAGEALIVEDARKHPLVNRNPAIRDLGVIAYLGFPIVHAGVTLGSFCVIDQNARVWTPDEIASVRDFAALASREIELRVARLRTAQSPVLTADEPSTPRDLDETEGDAAPAAWQSSFAQTFIETRLADVSQAREQIERGDYEAIARLGHQLKGSSAMLGFPEIGRLGGELERAARQGDAVPIEAVLDLLGGELRREQVAQTAAG